MKRYSAGIVSKGFWFLEFKKYLQLEKKGKTKAEIKELQLTENIFTAPSIDYGKKIFGEVSKRCNALDQEIKDIFFDLDVANQRIVDLISVMKTDLLFFEFVYYGYREELLIGSDEYSLKIVRKFLGNKQTQDDEVANFTDNTIKRMCGAYSTYLKEAGLIDDVSGTTKFKRVVLDYRLEKILEKEELIPILKAIKGVA